MDLSETPGSATEAFEKNTIPTVRVLEQQLRADILRNRERLRALVGGNYRELLSTAEGIVSLDKRTKDAEGRISDLSRQCKPPQQSDAARSISTISSISAQLRLLTQCITCASAALQARSVLLCAELTVVSRLLLKSLGEQQSPPAAITGFRSKAAALRRRLLRLIRSQLAHPASSVDALVNAICAYCLVTSASSVDAVEHFRNVRLEKLRQRVESEENDPSRIKEDFRYLVVSLQLLKSVLGRSVNDALAVLQKQPLLQGQNVAKLEALDIDRLRNLIPADILEFTPYIKRVLLKQGEVQQISSTWIRDACQVFEKGLRAALIDAKSIADVLALRKDLLSVILPVYFSTPALEALLQTVRQVTNARVAELSRTHIEGLVQIGKSISSARPGTVKDSSLWATSLIQNSNSSQGSSYAHQVQSSHLGTKGDLAVSLKKMRKWTKQIGKLRSQIEALESIRWQDILEEPDDDDEDHANDIAKQLSKDDPERFKKAMDQSLQNAMSQFNTILHDAVAEAVGNKEGESDDDSISSMVHLLRVLRESSNTLNHLESTTKIELTAPVSQLHKALAGLVTKRIKSIIAQDTSSTDVSLQPDDLPSPRTFKVLRDICKIMAETGGVDIWSAAAVSTLKQELFTEMFNDGRPVYVSNDFDEHYMNAALNILTQNQANSNDQDDAKAKAQAYWQRTKLLFGALGS